MVDRSHQPCNGRYHHHCRARPSGSCRAGAGGGTVLNSRSVIDEGTIPSVGANFAEEKEIVLIVANAETKLAIMQAISESCGIQTEAKGLVYSLPIDNVIGLSD